MLWINYLLAIGLTASILAQYISPQSFWPLAFFGLAYPLLLVANLVFVVYWFFQLRWLGLISLSIALAGYSVFGGFVQLNPGGEEPSNKDIKIMSYNCMLFDLYNWSKNKGTRAEILNMLTEENPDILCLQEFYNSEEANDFHNADTLTQLLRARNIHCEYTATLRKMDHWGIATLTRYPIVNKGKILFNTRSNNICIYTDVFTGTDTLRIYNMHLQSISFSKEDYRFLDDISKDKETDEIKNSTNILRRLKRAFVKRSTQADAISEHIRQCPYKVIVCGDFNDTPASYTYHTISKNLKDAFRENGNGLGRTYAGKFPKFRIDYILYDARLEGCGYERVEETLTDHYPIVCYIRPKSKADAQKE